MCPEKLTIILSYLLRIIMINKLELLLRCFVPGLFVSSIVESFHLMEERQGSKIELQQNSSFDIETDDQGTQNIASHVCVCVCVCFFFFFFFFRKISSDVLLVVKLTN